MEHTIRNHSRSYEVFILLLPINSNIEIIKIDENHIVFRNNSGYMMWKYVFHKLSNPMETIIKDSIEVVKFATADDELINLWAENISISWGINGSLVGENYDDRTIEHLDEDMIISINGVNYIYNLEKYLQRKNIVYLVYYYGLRSYRDKLEMFMEGNLDVINLIDPNDGAFFYIDKKGKINAILDLWVDLIKTNRLFGSNPAKLIEEAEKLRMDFRKYTPRLTD